MRTISAKQSIKAHKFIYKFGEMEISMWMKLEIQKKNTFPNQQAAVACSSSSSNEKLQTQTFELTIV